MKILHVINNLGSGGAEKLLVDYLKFDYSNFDHSIYLLSKKRNVYLEELENISVNVFISKRLNRFSPFHLKDLQKQIITLNPDIIHCHLFPTFYWVGIIARKYNNIKFVFTEHGSTNRRRYFPLLKHIEKYIYNSYDKIVCISQSVYDTTDKWLNYNLKEKLQLIYNGTEIKDKVKDLSINSYQKLCIEKNNFVISMIARFSKEKNHSILIEALESIEFDYKLLLVGEGPLKRKVKKLVHKKKLNDKVVFTGYLKNVSDVYNVSNLVVIPSKHEGFGLTAIETMSYGIPLIVSNIPSLLEITNNGAISFIGNSKESLANKIKLIYEKKIPIDLKSNALKQARKFDINITVYNLNMLYQDITC